MKKLIIPIIALSLFFPSCLTVFGAESDTNEIEQYLEAVVNGEHDLFKSEPSISTLSEDDFPEEEKEWLAKRGLTVEEVIEDFNNYDVNEITQGLESYDMSTLKEFNCTRLGSELFEILDTTDVNIIDGYNSLDDQFVLWTVNGVSPNGNKSEITLTKSERTDRISTSTYVEYEGEGEEYISDEEVIEIVKELLENDIEIVELKNISFGLGHTRTELSCVITEEGTEYIVPFSYVNETLGLEKGQIYTTEEVKEALHENYQKDQSTQEELSRGMGGGDSGSINGGIDKNALMPLISLIGLFGGFLLFKYSKKAVN